MRTAFALTALVILGLSVSPARALDLEVDVDWFSFSGWDNTTVVGGGQAFTGVIGAVDATVDGVGSFTLPSKIKGVSDQLIISGHATPGSNTFNFSLSSSLPLVIEYRTVDSQEKFILDAIGSKTHTHILGAAPDVMTVGNVMTVMGKDTGVPGAGNLITGASAGYIETSSLSSFSITHEGLRNNKFEAFRIGTVRIPEPEGIILAILGLAPMALRRNLGTKQA